MLIFDKFRTNYHALKFMDAVREQYGLEAKLYHTVADSNAADPFPYMLYPPIVHVERSEEDEFVESAVETMVGSYGGQFAGT